MLLTGSAVLTQDTNRFAGEQVNYLQKTGVIEAQGGDAGRVEMTLTPKKSDS
jgi:lipopolysaccharide export system protein LptA